MRIEFQAGEDDSGRRLESVARRLLPGLSLSEIYKALRRGDIRLNGAKAEPASPVSTGDKLAVWQALLARNPKAHSVASSSSDELPSEWILYSGDDLLALNKPSGLVVHRGDHSPGFSAEKPLDDRVRAWLAPSLAPSLSFRPGPLHRLDRETSGIVVFSRTLVGARTFSVALAAGRVKKTYLAVLRGRLDSERLVEATLLRDDETRTTKTMEDGESASTLFRPMAHGQGSGGLLTLVEVELGTGRTHQIRAHAQSLGSPLAGDRKYGGGETPSGLDVPWLLHAWKLSCTPLLNLTAPVPTQRALWVKKIFKISL